MKEGTVINYNLISTVFINDYNVLIIDSDYLRNRKRVACVYDVIFGRFRSKPGTPRTT